MRSPTRRAIALIPLRGSGKSRLGGAIDGRRRVELVSAMFTDVVRALREADVEDVRVLAGDERAIELASASGLEAVPDPQRTGSDDPSGDARLRLAVDAALRELPQDGPRLVVAADIPRLDGREITAALVDPADVVIVPTADGGTAILRLGPGVVIPARYGRDSANEHRRAAEERGNSTAVLHMPGAQHDVDAARDLRALARPLDGMAPGPATAAFRALPGGYAHGERTRS